MFYLPFPLLQHLATALLMVDSKCWSRNGVCAEETIVPERRDEASCQTDGIARTKVRWKRSALEAVGTERRERSVLFGAEAQ